MCQSSPAPMSTKVQALLPAMRIRVPRRLRHQHMIRCPAQTPRSPLPPPRPPCREATRRAPQGEVDPSLARLTSTTEPQILWLTRTPTMTTQHLSTAAPAGMEGGRLEPGALAAFATGTSEHGALTPARQTTGLRALPCSLLNSRAGRRDCCSREPTSSTPLHCRARRTLGASAYCKWGRERGRSCER